MDIYGGRVGWLEVRQEDGYLDADLLWVDGSVFPVANVYLSWPITCSCTRTNNIIRTRDDKDNPLRTHIIN